MKNTPSHGPAISAKSITFTRALCFIAVCISLLNLSAEPERSPTPPATSTTAASRQNTGGNNPSAKWDLGGNLGTDPLNNWIGTDDAQDLVFKTNLIEQMRISSTGIVTMKEGLAIYGSGLTVVPYGSSPGQTISMNDDLTSALSVSDGVQSDYTFQLYSNGSTLINLTSPPGSNAPNWGVGFRINVIDPHTGNIGGNLFNVTPWGSVGIGVTNPATIPYKMLTVNGNASLANYNASGGNATNGLNGIEIIGAGKVPARRGIATGDDPSGDLDFFINSNQAAAAFHFKNGAGSNFQNYPTSGAAPDLMRLDASGTLQIGRESLGSASSAPFAGGISYLGFNVERQDATHWRVGSDGTRNGGATILQDMFGHLTFFAIPSTGSSDQFLTDQNLVNYNGLSLGQDGATIVGDIHLPAWAQFIVSPTPAMTNALMVFNRTTNKEVFTTKSDGTTHIGAEVIVPGNPHTNALLQVGGKIVCKELIVLDPNKWADDVFEKHYELLSPGDLESYYLRNKHLPDVPTETEVKTNGINAAEMDATLLRKVEELTLYMVAQNKRIEKLEAENNALKRTPYYYAR